MSPRNQILPTTSITSRPPHRGSSRFYAWSRWSICWDEVALAGIDQRACAGRRDGAAGRERRMKSAPAKPGRRDRRCGHRLQEIAGSGGVDRCRLCLIRRDPASPELRLFRTCGSAAHPAFGILHEFLIGDGRGCSCLPGPVDAWRPGPSDESRSEMIYDLTTIAVSVVLWILQVFAKLMLGKAVPTHGEWREPPFVVGAGDATGCVVRSSVTGGTRQAGRTIICGSTHHMEHVSMPVVALARKARQGMAILTAGAGHDACNRVEGVGRRRTVALRLRPHRRHEGQGYHHAERHTGECSCLKQTANHHAPRTARCTAARMRA